MFLKQILQFTIRHRSVMLLALQLLAWSLCMYAPFLHVILNFTACFLALEHYSKRAKLHVNEGLSG